MSQGGVYKLLVADARVESYFTATSYLSRRLDEVRAARKAAGEHNVQPRLEDIKATHNFYLRSSFRPHVATASEYTRVKPIGDAAGAITAAGGTVEFTFPAYGHFTSDIALRIRFREIGNPAKAGAAIDDAGNATPETPILRYCSLPGVRALEKVEFHSNKVLVDDYTRDDVMAAAKFFVGADKRTGWERCMGQQEVREASYFGNNYTGVLSYRDGPQTMKLYQPAFEVIVPLDFWFCRDASRALLNDLIPNGQRTVTVKFAPIDQIVAAFLPDGITAGQYVPTPLPFQRLQIDCELFVNSIYVNPEIHQVFSSRIGMSLIRVHRRQATQLQHAEGAVLLDQLKYPAEFLTVGVRMRSNTRDFDGWWVMGAPAVRNNTSRLFVATTIWNTTLGGVELVAREAFDSGSNTPMVESLGIAIQGVDVFPSMPAPFFNAYLPIRYPETSGVVAPADSSAYLFPFCVYPGRYEPSGHFNLSTTREVYLKYALTAPFRNIGPGEAEVVVSMSALNFLVRRGDSLALQYAL
jgi:hypothetical protein